MKIFTPFSILILTFIGYSFSSPANVPLLFSEKTGTQSQQKEMLDDNPSREFLTFKLYDFDRAEDKFVLSVSGSFGNLTEVNSYTDTLHYHNIYGGIYYDEFIAHQLDNLGRDTMISWTNNEGGSPNYALKKRVHMNYYKDTWRLAGRYTETLGFTDLELAKSEEWTMDTMGNVTSFILQDFDPNSGVVINYSADSILFVYDTLGNIVQQTLLSYDSFQDRMIPGESRIWDWSGDTLTSVVVNVLNEDGSLNYPGYKIDQISTTKMTPLYEILPKTQWEVIPWSDASSHRRSQYINDKWKPESVQDVLEDYFNGSVTTTTSLWEVDEFVPWKRTTDSNVQHRLLKKMKYLFPQSDFESFYKDYSEETYSIDDGWVTLFSSIINKKLSTTSESVTENKSAALGDSVLTLIKQTYDPGSGEWLDNFKQEFTFRNIGTEVNEINFEDNITIYPNPTDGLIHVQLNGIQNLIRIDVINSTGQTITSAQFDKLSGNHFYQTDLKHFDKGLYFIKVFMENKVISRKIILM